MIVDTSVLVAITRREPGWEQYAAALETNPGAMLAAPTYVESSVVIGGPGREVSARALDVTLRQWDIDIVGFDARQAQIAARAYRQYGRGSGHRARLDLGDVYSYALAAAADEPLLYKGDDFVHTDLRSALDA